jgi:uncharacterized membrane protein
LKDHKTLVLAQFGILLAIEAIFCFTPLGSIPISPTIVATLMMVPVIITALLLGTKAGTLMGAFAGLFSFIVWTFTPPNPAIAFTFTPFYSFGEISGNFGSVLICFVPRILAGAVTGLTYSCASKFFAGKIVLCLALSAIAGSFTNTVGVLGGQWLFFGQYFADSARAMLAIIGAIMLTNAIPEAIISALAAPAVCKPLKKILSR